MTALSSVQVYERFDANCPDFYPYFSDLALSVAALGRGFFGANAIVERLRWDVKIGVLDMSMRFVEDEDEDTGFKIPSQVVAFYARRFILDHPQHKHFFELRWAPEPDAYFGIVWKQIGIEKKSGKILRVVDWDATFAQNGGPIPANGAGSAPPLPLAANAP